MALIHVYIIIFRFNACILSLFIDAEIDVFSPQQLYKYIYVNDEQIFDALFSAESLR